MELRLKQFLALFLLVSAGGALGFRALANPFDQLTPDNPLYQRVKHLEDYGLLDPQDQAKLDQGKIVSRLELAFYTEKAKARLTAPELLQPTPTFTPQPIPTPMPIAIPTPIPTPMAPPVNPWVRQEIDNLLKELKQESELLRTHLSLYDNRLAEWQKEMEKLNTVQDDVNATWKKANKSSGIPNFSTKTRFRFENLTMSGITVVNAIRTANSIDLGMWSDFGGKGAISLGLTGTLTDANANSQGASFGIYNPDVSFQFDGPLGRWDTHFMAEGYPGAGTLGDFTRGIGPTSLKRYVNPVDIKHFSDDKDQKTWDDYVSNISAVPPSSAAGAIVSSFDPVFSGIYGIGSNLPWLGQDGNMVLMFGRMGTQNTQGNRFEQAAKLSKNFGTVQAALSTEWINDDFGVNQVPQLDLKTYQASLGFDLKPVRIDVEAGFSHLYSGIDNGQPAKAALEAPAGQVQISYYPFNLFYTAISDSFANFNSKVAMAGVNFNQYGVYAGPGYTSSSFEDAYGLVGEVDNLVSNRYGWRANLGWDGRKQDWMRGWPSFLDDIVVNFDFAQKTEYRAVQSPTNVGTDSNGDPVYNNYNFVEAFNVLSPYYQEDEGIWGLDLWGGYAAAPWLPARQAYDNNIEALRNDGDISSGQQTRYQFTLSSERIPLMMPVTTGGGAIVVNGSAPGVVAGTNAYTMLTHLKTYSYITLTTKYQFNKMFGIDQPLYGSVFFTDNRVSGKAQDPSQSDISNLFEQQVVDFGAMYQLIRNVNIMGEYGWETWKCAYTYPLVDYRTDVIGGGFAYDIPWGSGKFELRYKDVTFKDAYVPANSYHTGQWISEFYLLF
ncbi:MAG TPA: hypothetical protein VHE12_00790 [bacterium]|nr:hypothetical protein [bacterium]